MSKSPYDCGHDVDFNERLRRMIEQKEWERRMIEQKEWEREKADQQRQRYVAAQYAAQQQAMTQAEAIAKQRVQAERRQAIALDILKVLLSRFDGDGATAAIRVAAKNLAEQAYAMADAFLAEGQR